MSSIFYITEPLILIRFQNSPFLNFIDLDKKKCVLLSVSKFGLFPWLYKFAWNLILSFSIQHFCFFWIKLKFNNSYRSTIITMGMTRKRDSRGENGKVQKILTLTFFNTVNSVRCQKHMVWTSTFKFWCIWIIRFYTWWW